GCGAGGVCGALWPFIGPAKRARLVRGIGEPPDPHPGHTLGGPGAPLVLGPGTPGEPPRRVTIGAVTTFLPERLPLRRPVAERRIGGVCAGLAAHLGLPVARVRLAVLLSVLAFGAGIVLYGWLWVL